MPKKSQELTARRNERIYERYLYWTEQQRLRFDYTIQTLSEREFFLSEGYIIEIIKKEMARLENEGIPQPRQRYLSVDL